MTITTGLNTFLLLGTGQTRCIVNNLARDLHIDPELSAQLAAVAKSTQPYLYAVSAPVKPDNAKYSYADLLSSSEQKSPKENAKKPKVKHAPQPLPHQHLKVKESALDDPNLRRPLSLTDLRPPPTSPPPPLPKHGKLCYILKLGCLYKGELEKFIKTLKKTKEGYILLIHLPLCKYCLTLNCQAYRLLVNVVVTNTHSYTS